jgi:hypothetical protein
MVPVCWAENSSHVVQPFHAGDLVVVQVDLAVWCHFNPCFPIQNWAIAEEWRDRGHVKESRFARDVHAGR